MIFISRFEKGSLYHIECWNTIPLGGEVCNKVHLNHLLSSIMTPKNLVPTLSNKRGGNILYSVTVPTSVGTIGNNRLHITPNHCLNSVCYIAKPLCLTYKSFKYIHHSNIFCCLVASHINHLGENIRFMHMCVLGNGVHVI